MNKQSVIQALRGFIAQRSGMDFANYGDVSAYRSEQRSITRDLHHARALLSAVEWRDSITGDDIAEAAKHAFSGRLSIVEKGDKVAIEYCVRQYFPTEYRKAVCAVLAAALWDYVRTGCMPEGELVHNSETGETFKRYRGMRAGDFLRSHFRKEFGRGIASRWFN